MDFGIVIIYYFNGAIPIHLAKMIRRANETTLGRKQSGVFETGCAPSSLPNTYCHSNYVDDGLPLLINKGVPIN